MKTEYNFVNSLNKQKIGTMKGASTAFRHFLYALAHCLAHWMSGRSGEFPLALMQDGLLP